MKDPACQLQTPSATSELSHNGEKGYPTTVLSESVFLWTVVISLARWHYYAIDFDDRPF